MGALGGGAVRLTMVANVRNAAWLRGGRLGWISAGPTPPPAHTPLLPLGADATICCCSWDWQLA